MAVSKTSTIVWGIEHLMKKGQDLPANIMRNLQIIQAIVSAEKRFGKNNFYHSDIGQPLDHNLPIHKLIVQGSEFAVSMLKKSPELRGYTSPVGLLVLRESFADFYKKYWRFEIDPETLLISNGASEIWNAFVHSSLWPGDLVLTCDPHYNPFDVALAETGAGWLSIKTKAENGYHFTKTDFEKTLLRKPKKGSIKAVYINSPSNPTGVIYSKKEIDLFVDFALKNQLFIVMDSVYALYNYSNNPNLVDYLKSIPKTKLEKINDRLILLDSMSKLAHNPGVRIGMGMIPNPETRKQMFSDLSIRGNVQNHGQMKSAFVLDKIGRNPTLLNDQKLLYRKKMAIAYQIVKKNLMDKRIIPSSPPPEGSLYLTIKTGFDNFDFLIWSMTKYQGKNATSFVPLTVGKTSFRAVDADEGRRELRLCIGSDLKIIEAAIDSFVNQVIAYKKFISEAG